MVTGNVVKDPTTAKLICVPLRMALPSDHGTERNSTIIFYLDVRLSSVRVVFRIVIQ